VFLLGAGPTHSLKFEHLGVLSLRVFQHMDLHTGTHGELELSGAWLLPRVQCEGTIDELILRHFQCRMQVGMARKRLGLSCFH
jgi:hypothetical protein